MSEEKCNALFELEDMVYSFETIERLILIIQENYYNKNDVDYKKIEDYYDLCVSYKQVSTLLETVQNIARDNQEKFYNLFSTKKDIKS